MNATPGHPALRSCVEASLADCLEGRTAVSVGAMLGIAKSTITRRGPELASWPATDFLQLAATCDPLTDSIFAFLKGERRDGQSLQLQGDLLTDISDSAVLANAIADALKDNRLSLEELCQIERLLMERRRHEDETLLPDLKAAIARAK